MDFKLSDDLEMLRKVVREFATKQIAPFADEWDNNHYFPYKEAVKPMGELGFFGTVIPEAYGGTDMGWLAAMIITEEIARASSSLRVQVNMQGLGCAYPILKYGSDEIKKIVDIQLERLIARLEEKKLAGLPGYTMINLLELVHDLRPREVVTHPLAPFPAHILLLGLFHLIDHAL